MLIRYMKIAAIKEGTVYTGSMAAIAHKIGAHPNTVQGWLRKRQLRKYWKGFEIYMDLVSVKN